jgi:hypothetical protein
MSQFVAASTANLHANAVLLAGNRWATVTLTALTLRYLNQTTLLLPIPVAARHGLNKPEKKSLYTRA